MSPITQKNVQSFLKKEQGGKVSWLEYKNLRTVKAQEIIVPEYPRKEVQGGQYNLPETQQEVLWLLLPHLWCSILHQGWEPREKGEL